jgi:hypothetical protein
VRQSTLNYDLERWTVLGKIPLRPDIAQRRADDQYGHNRVTTIELAERKPHLMVTGIATFGDSVERPQS